MKDDLGEAEQAGSEEIDSQPGRTVADIVASRAGLGGSVILNVVSGILTANLGLPGFCRLVQPRHGLL